MFDSSFDVSKWQEIAQQVLTEVGRERFAQYLKADDYEMAQIVLLGGIDRCFLVNRISHGQTVEAIKALDLSADVIQSLRASKRLRLVA